MSEEGLAEKDIEKILKREMVQASAFVKALRAKTGGTFDCAIGTGGNFESMGKLRVALLERSSVYSMTAVEVAAVQKHLRSMSVKERIRYLNLREDRADVIIPALILTQMIMSENDIEVLFIPHVGLREGLLLDILTGR
jgi:exopolyphosphatase/pppGpp-phosphohydrolase